MVDTPGKGVCRGGGVSSHSLFINPSVVSAEQVKLNDINKNNAIFMGFDTILNKLVFNPSQIILSFSATSLLPLRVAPIVPTGVRSR